MHFLSASLSLKDGVLERFLEFVNTTPGVKSGSNPPDFFGWNSLKFAWVKLESQFLNAADLATLLRSAGFAVDVYDENEHEPREQVS
ncbi:hypothetical protein H6788_02460 [Candidatus Nomurabacteria bacterium]|nr:hypothetical protein [Candidatus Nomurabacteria bacterium]MCB9819088.1 hypothetical protein [Candidatus Nomurabacteria bacterium]